MQNITEKAERHVPLFYFADSENMHLAVLDMSLAQLDMHLAVLDILASL